MFFPGKQSLRDWWNIKMFPCDVAPDQASGVEWTPRENRIAWASILIASVFLLAVNLSYPLIEPDETRYAQIAMEMNRTGDWITPRLDGEAYLDKPPLMYWLTATSFWVFGTSEAAARLPSALAVLGTILITFGLGRRIVGPRAAWMGSLALILCGAFMLAGRFLIIDPLLGLMTTLCLFSGYLGLKSERHRKAWWALASLACALGVLTKGPIALVLCGPPLVTIGWLRRDGLRSSFLEWFVFGIPIVAICVPWYIAVWASNPEFGDYFFLEHNLKRFTQGSNHEQPFWFYAPILFAVTFPTAFLLPSLGFFLFGRSDQHRLRRSRDLGFLMCSTTWILLFFSLSSCKLPTYILPCIPLIGLMIGVMLDQTVFRPELPNGVTRFLQRFPQRTSLCILLTCLGLVGGDAFLRGQISPFLIATALTCIALLVVTLAVWNRPMATTPRAWAVMTVLLVLVSGWVLARFVPTVSQTRSVYVKTLALWQQHPDCLIVFYGEKPHAASIQLPADKIVYFPSKETDSFVEFMSKQKDIVLVTADEKINATRAEISESHELIPSQSHEHIYLARQAAGSDAQVAGQTEPRLR